MERTHRVAGFASHVAWNESALRRTAWFRQNQAVLELYRQDPWANCAKCKSAYLYVWKPFVILERVRAVPEGDFVYYTDASKYFRTGIDPAFGEAKQVLGRLAAEQKACTCLPGFRLPAPLSWTWQQSCTHQDAGSRRNLARLTDPFGAFCEFVDVARSLVTVEDSTA